MERFRATGESLLQLARVRALLFGRYAWQDADDRQKIDEAGSGIFVAPRVGLSARHVSESFRKLDEQLAGRARRRTVLDPQYMAKPVEADFGQQLYQPPPQFEPDAELTWRYKFDWPSHDTDISALVVEPKSLEAMTLEPTMRFLEWQLLPPPPGATIYIFGWGKQEIHVEGDEHGLESELWFYGRRVTEVFDVMRGHGMWEFPGYVLSGVEDPLPHGLSGAAVVYNGRLAGIFSGPDYVASLWPLALMSYPDGERERSFAELFDLGEIRTRDWDEVRGKVERVACERATEDTAVVSRCMRMHAILKS